MLDLLQQFLVTIAVSYLGLTNSLADHIHTLFNDTDRDQAFIALHTEPAEPASDRSDPARTMPDVLRQDQNFQQAALLAAQESSAEGSLSDTREAEAALKEALVNVFCQYRTDTYVRTTTGTGFFANSKGVILTNAHVAQFLLLEEGTFDAGDVECVIRTGDPATPRYKAELLYISPAWILDNADLITKERPFGTGERDYALLYVSGSLDDTPLPDHFPALPLDAALISRSAEGRRITIGGYPAGALLRGGADAALLPVTAESTMSSLYTFGSNYADVFAVPGSPVGEEGASGGPVLDTETGKAIGLIVTRGDASEGARSLRALTLSYIDRTIQEETGFSLVQNMQGDIRERGKIFKEAMVPFLADALEGALEPAGAGT
jgi:hypothetical protein